MKFRLITTTKKLLADTLTPVNIYLKVRDVYAGSILLESSDYHGHENSLSFICCDPIASFQVKNDSIETRFPNGEKFVEKIERAGQVLQGLDNFRLLFECDTKGKNISAGMFGYMTYDAVRYFEDLKLEVTNRLVPEILYKVYRYV